MDLTLLGVVIGAILILILIRGLGFYGARTTAARAYRQGMNAEITGSPRRRVRAPEPRPPEQAYISGENRYERGPGMEAPPVYSKDDAPPDYGEVATETTAPRTTVEELPLPEIPEQIPEPMPAVVRVR